MRVFLLVFSNDSLEHSKSLFHHRSHYLTPCKVPPPHPVVPAIRICTKLQGGWPLQSLSLNPSPHRPHNSPILPSPSNERHILQRVKGWLLQQLDVLTNLHCSHRTLRYAGQCHIRYLYLLVGHIRNTTGRSHTQHYWW